MEITRDVIQDLMPLYLAGEASPDSRVLVEAFLRTHPDLARLAEESKDEDWADHPIPISKESEMKAYQKANKMMVIRTLGLAVIIAGTLLAILLIVPLIFLFIV